MTIRVDLTSFRQAESNPATAADFSASYPIVGHWPQHAQLLTKDNEHYKLLWHLTRQITEAAAQSSINNTIDLVDVGSSACLSVAAIAAGLSEDRIKNVRITTYDRAGLLTDQVKQLPDSALSCAAARSVRIKPPGIDLLMDASLDVSNAYLVAIDVEPHDGQYERSIIEHLMNEGYRGLIVIDEIRMNTAMANLWKWVPLKKIDVTEIAHWSGTGIAICDPTFIDVKF